MVGGTQDMAERATKVIRRRRMAFVWAGSAVAATAVVTAFVLMGPLAHGSPTPVGPQAVTVASIRTTVRAPNFDSASVLDMTSPETGWVAWSTVKGLHGGSILAVARTTDQGRTWVNVTPRANLAGDKLFVIPTGVQGAFLAAIRPGKTVTVYVTHDGGKTWTHGNPVPILYGDGGAHLTSNGRDVWMEVGAGGARASVAQLFRSDDDGITWWLVAETQTHVSTGSALPGFGWIAFTNTVDGFTSAQLLQGTGFSGLYMTTDGGTKWTPVPIGSGWEEIGPPRFTGPDGLAAIYLANPNQSSAELLRTTDDGRTWTNTFPVPPLVTINTGTDVLSGEVALIAGFSGNIHRTTDGGRSWQTLSPAPSSHDLMERNVIGYLSFYSPEVGWAIMGPRAQPNANQTLYLTTNGGATWKEMAK